MRLTPSARGVVKQLEQSDPVLGDQILGLVLMDPSDAVAWIRAHLDDLEARFTS